MTATDEAVIAFLRAAEVGACDELTQHLAAGMSADGGVEPGGWTPLMRAASVGHAAAVSILIDAGADLDARWIDGEHETALMEAAEAGHSDVVRLLLDAGAARDLQDEHGETALMRAAVGGHLSVVELLIAQGADLDLVDADGNSALFRAAVWDRLPVVAALLRAGAAYSMDSLRELMLGKAVSGSTDSFLALLGAGLSVDPELLSSLDKRGLHDLARRVRERE